MPNTKWQFYLFFGQDKEQIWIDFKPLYWEEGTCTIRVHQFSKESYNLKKIQKPKPKIEILILSNSS